MKAIDVIRSEAERLADDMDERDRAGCSQRALWGIMNRREQVMVADGFEYDRVEWYDANNDCSLTSRDLIEDEIDNDPDFVDDCIEETFGEDVVVDSATGELTHDVTCLPTADAPLHERLLMLDGVELEHCLEQVSDTIADIRHFERRNVRDIWGLEPDRLFLTKADAEAHLRDNAHHYAEGAHPVCLGLWRSPHMSLLMDALLALPDEMGPTLGTTDAPYDPGPDQMRLDF